jgi:hypothetical protein
MLAPRLLNHPALWRGRLVEAIAALWGLRPAFGPGRYFPKGLLPVVRRTYRIVFGRVFYEEMRKRTGFGPARKLRYNALVRKGYRYLKRALEKVEVIARTSFSKADFWSRLEAYFCGRPLQGRLNL